MVSDSLTALWIVKGTDMTDSRPLVLYKCIIHGVLCVPVTCVKNFLIKDDVPGHCRQEIHAPIERPALPGITCTT